MKGWRAALLPILLLLVLVSAGCGPKKPDGLIPESRMEELLYDFHLAEGLARIKYDRYDTNIIAYRAAVLKKYDVTQAQFDTSMVYYMRHTETLYHMYQRIAKRLENKSAEMGSPIGMLAGKGRYGVTGDTADIWKGNRTIVLINKLPYNLYTFSYAADTTFHKGDSFILSFQSDFVFQDGTRDAMVMLALYYANDSVATRQFHVTVPTQNTLTIADDDSLGVKAIRGFFMLQEANTTTATSSTLHLMTLGQIYLLRCHPSKQRSQGPEKGTSHDSLPADAGRRRTPVTGAPPDTSSRILPKR